MHCKVIGVDSHVAVAVKQVSPVHATLRDLFECDSYAKFIHSATLPKQSILTPAYSSSYTVSSVSKGANQAFMIYLQGPYNCDTFGMHS